MHEKNPIMARMSPKPQKNVPKTTIPAFDLLAEGRTVLNDFPHMQDHLFYLNVDTCDIHGMEPVQSEDLYYYRINKTSGCFNPDDDKDLFFVLFSPRSNETFLGTDIDKNQQLHFVFDHETAHAIIPEGFAQSQLAESIADAYGLLRHYQRYGVDTDFGEHLLFRRAASTILSPTDDIKHFTNPVLERIVWMRKHWDIKNMSVTDTAKLAQILGEKYAMNNKNLKSIKKDFEKVSKHVKQMRKKTKRAYTTAEKIKNPLAQKWAVQVLLELERKRISAKTKTICFRPLKESRKPKLKIVDYKPRKKR